MTTLCAPTSEVTCFGCCPPIRPPHYDPLDYAGSLRREFSENRAAFLTHGPGYRPIVGYSCWALGFLDARGRTVGCLLHPAQNGGQDLRELVDYGSKCARESCLPAREFSRLPPQGRRFWLTLVAGYNSFYYSSRRANPLFHILEWGARLLEILRLQSLELGWSSTELLARHRFLLAPNLKPRAHRYILAGLLSRSSLAACSPQGLYQELQQIRSAAVEFDEAQGPPPCDQPAHPAHQLPLPHDLLDFIRFGLGLPRTSLERAGQLKAYLDRLIER